MEDEHDTFRVRIVPEYSVSKLRRQENSQALLQPTTEQPKQVVFNLFYHVKHQRVFRSLDVVESRVGGYDEEPIFLIYTSDFELYANGDVDAVSKELDHMLKWVGIESCHHERFFTYVISRVPEIAAKLQRPPENGVFRLNFRIIREHKVFYYESKLFKLDSLPKHEPEREEEEEEEEEDDDDDDGVAKSPNLKRLRVEDDSEAVITETAMSSASYGMPLVAPRLFSVSL